VKSNHSRILLLLVALLTVGLFFLGCTRSIGLAKGWAGGVIVDDNIFIGSMEGTLIALSISEGRQLGEPVSLGIETSSNGGLACIPASCARGASTGVAIYGSPTVDGTLVYVAGYDDGAVYAFQFQEGRLREQPKWYSRPRNISGNIVGGLVIAQGNVYYGTSNGNVYAVDAIDGYRKWMTELPDRIWATPTISGDTLFIACFDKKLYALDAETGEEKWDEPFETEGAIISTPLVHNNTVYIGSFDRRFYAVDATSGRELWRYPVNDEDEGNPTNWFWAKPLIHNGVIYAPCLDGKVYALDAEDGRWLRNFDLGSPISSSPVLVDDLIIVATQNGLIYTLNTTDNQQERLDHLEENEKVYAPLFAGDGKVYVHTTMDVLYQIDVQSGASKVFTLTTGE